MKLLVLYRPHSEHATEVETFVRELTRQHDMANQIQMISMDTREGTDMAELYGVMEFPALIAIAREGSVLNMWHGLPLPLMNDVAGYVRSA